MTSHYEIYAALTAEPSDWIGAAWIVAIALAAAWIWGGE